MKKIGWFVLVLATPALVWYLFVRDFEFEVNFRIKTIPGDVIRSMRIWNNTLPDAQIVRVDSFKTVLQVVRWHGEVYHFRWNFESINDTTTAASILVSQDGRRVLNKLLVPFTEQQVERDAGVIVKEFYDMLKTHLEMTDVKIMGEAEVASSFCICRSLKTLQTHKAYGMMSYHGLLTSFIADANLKPDGLPLIRITRWIHNNDSLAYDFCFPIKQQTDLPVSDSVSYKNIEAVKALKAVYHGHYFTSDRAWYQLLTFAERNGYEVAGLPVEYFFSNPNLGSDDTKWRAEIYLPIK